MELNKNEARRLEILGVEEGYGDLVRIKDITLEQLKTLVDEGFADPQECQNESPSIEEFMEFMEQHEGFTAHGYIVSPERRDYRVTVDGIRLNREANVEELRDFTNMFRSASEFDIDGELYCWYD